MNKHLENARLADWHMVPLAFRDTKRPLPSPTYRSSCGLNIGLYPTILLPGTCQNKVDLYITSTQRIYLTVHLDVVFVFIRPLRWWLYTLYAINHYTRTTFTFYFKVVCRLHGYTYQAVFLTHYGLVSTYGDIYIAVNVGSKLWAKP